MNYEELLDQLRTGELDQFVLEAKDFKEFYEVWRNYPYQNAIRGIADRGGVVTYTANELNKATDLTGKRVLLTGFGAGFTYGSLLLEF
ncbi:hypothetical protein H7R52_05150 [Weissella confusa]|uniref:Beta-ketoacyl-[acyl-carrier-protein] synthase III C-terminal domain-containing protein n=1 Tax=Weissella confusa TaxID=1583 RepID=A0A923NEB8_WEICO|nr:hypothetical protein [Weissella confusa]